MIIIECDRCKRHLEKDEYDKIPIHADIGGRQFHLCDSCSKTIIHEIELPSLRRAISIADPLNPENVLIRGQLGRNRRETE